MAPGLDYSEVVPLANLAGGVEVERWGVVPLGREDLIRDLESPGTDD